MHKRLAVFVLAIVIMACFLRVDAADDSNSLRASSDRHRAQDAGGSDGAAEPASESSDAEGPAAEPDSFCPENRQDRCLGIPNCRACPCVYGEVEALLLEQVPLVQNRPIIVDANTGTTFLSTTDFGSDFDPGLRAMFGVRLCNGLAVEFSYFGLSEGGVAITEKPDPASYLIFSNNYAGNVFVNMNRIQTDFTSYVNSFELNFPCCCGCCTTCGCGETTCGECGPARPACGPVRCCSVEWFAGVRYLDIGNWLNMAVERNETGGVEEGSYNIRTSNHLIGGQIGARLRRTVNRFGWELTGKAGIYGNSAEQTQTVIDFPNFPLRPTTSASGSATAFVGEINLSGIYRLTDVWSAKAGYNAILIENLALAPDQLDFDFAASPSGTVLHRDGGLLLHGANVGLEARW